MVNLILPFTERTRESFLLWETSRTFLSNSLFLDITWKALVKLWKAFSFCYGLAAIQAAGFKFKCDLNSFLGEGCLSSEFDFFRLKSCSIVLELTYLARQVICTRSPVNLVELSPIRFLAFFIPLIPFSVNTTYELVSLRIIFKQQILQSSSVLCIYFIFHLFVFFIHI